MSECKHRRKDGVCLQDLEYVYKGMCVDGPCSCFEPQTNADRIRSMTDEELAFYIVNHPMWSDTDACTAWLKSPVEEEGE